MRLITNQGIHQFQVRMIMQFSKHAVTLNQCVTTYYTYKMATTLRLILTFIAALNGEPAFYVVAL